jgi:hypothetical protein
VIPVHSFYSQRIPTLVLCLFLGAISFAHASLIDLGAASGYGILGLDGATINLSSGPLRVNDNVGIGDNGALNFSGGGQINGSVNYSASATLNTGNNTISGGTHQISFSTVQHDALAEASFAASLAPTQTFSSITSAQTINGNGGRNVIAIGQDIHLSGGNLTLHGSANDTFIFNISGTMELSGNTNIVLGGGVTANNVLFNFIGSGSQVQTSGQSDTVGIFLAPSRVFNINGGYHQTEFISGMSLSFQSNPVVVPVPELTSSLVIFAFLTLIFATSLRKNRATR